MKVIYREANANDSLSISKLIVYTSINCFDELLKDIDTDKYISRKDKFIKYRIRHNLKYIVACIDNNIVGCIYYFIKNKTCFISDLFVDVKYQNMGIGKKLFEYVYNLDINKIYLNVICDSKAVNFYIKLGGKIIHMEEIIFFNKIVDAYVVAFDKQKES